MVNSWWDYKKTQLITTLSSPPYHLPLKKSFPWYFPLLFPSPKSFLTFPPPPSSNPSLTPSQYPQFTQSYPTSHSSPFPFLISSVLPTPYFYLIQSISLPFSFSNLYLLQSFHILFSFFFPSPLPLHASELPFHPSQSPTPLLSLSPAFHSPSTYISSFIPNPLFPMYLFVLTTCQRWY